MIGGREGLTEIPSQKTNVEESRRSHPEHYRRDGIEARQQQRVPRQIPADLPIPHRVTETLLVENARLHAIDCHAPQS